MKSLSLVRSKAAEPLSEARQALVGARDAHRAVAQEAAAARAADERAAEQVRSAEAALRAVRDRLEAAKQTLAASMTASAMGGPATDAGTLARIRAEETTALDVLEAAGAAKAQLAAAREEAERREAWSGQRVGTAAAAIVQEAMPEMLARAMAAQRELIRFRLGLRWLVASRVITEAPGMGRFMNRDAFLPQVVGGALDNSMEIEWAQLAGEAPWQALMQALQDDPAAPLPAVLDP